MFFSDPILDMEITLALVFVSACLGIIIGLLKKNWKIAIAVFSTLSNLAFLFAIFTQSRMFQTYHILWIFWVSVFIWPIINLAALVAVFLKNRYAK